MDGTKLIRFGLTGLGGYAGWACDQLLADSLSASPHVRLCAVCDPDPSAFPARIERLGRADVAIFEKLDDLLAENLDAVWLPLPIDLHRPFTERCLAAGKSVLVEKPAAGCIDDVDAMIRARDQSGCPIAVGFQNLFDPAAWTIKRRILDGVIGQPRRAAVVACWPRSDSYFSRNPWAGKLRRNGVWILDSPANNAMAHFLNLALFLLGPTEPQSAAPLSIQAELYRANPIENYDTCCLNCDLDGGCRLLVAMTHACRRDVNHPVITITGDRAAVHFWSNSRYEIVPLTAGQPPIESIPAHPHNGPLVFLQFAAHLRGESAPIATLENARVHTLAVNGASEASPIHDIPSTLIETIRAPDGSALRTVPGIEDAFETCVRTGRPLHASALVPWSRPAGIKSLIGYSHFVSPKIQVP